MSDRVLEDSSNDFSDKFPFNQMKFKKLPDGNHAVYIPKLYWRSNPEITRKAVKYNNSITSGLYAAFEISNVPRDGFELHPAFYKYPSDVLIKRAGEITFPYEGEVKGLWFGAYPLKADYQDTKLVSEPYKEDDTICQLSHSSIGNLPYSEDWLKDWHVETFFERTLLDLLFLIDKGSSYRDVPSIGYSSPFPEAIKYTAWRNIRNFYSINGECVYLNYGAAYTGSANNYFTVRPFVKRIVSDGKDCIQIGKEFCLTGTLQLVSQVTNYPFLYGQPKTIPFALPCFHYYNLFTKKKVATAGKEPEVQPSFLSSRNYSQHGSSAVQVTGFANGGTYIPLMYNTSSYSTFRFVKYEV